MRASFAGTGALVRLVLRRDRVRLTVWVVVLVGLVAWTAAGIRSIYTAPFDLAAYALTADGNATIIALSGPARGLETFGGRIAFEVWQLALAFGLFGILEVTRHTRHEEAGRTELLRATEVGRHAGSAAAIAVAAGASLLVGVVSAALLAAQDLPAGGSLVLGLGLASIGIAFAAVGLLAAQVTEHGRAATGLAVAVMGATYVARAVGDIGSGALSWVSPFGWAQASHPFTGDRWWPLLVAVLASLAVTAGALALQARRDLGAGLVAPRPGPAHAAPSLGSPLGLAWRLQRATLLAWTAGGAVVGLAMGSVADSADDLVGDNEQIRDYLASVHGASLDDVFLATMLVYLALLAAGFAVQAALRAEPRR